MKRALLAAVLSIGMAAAQGTGPGPVPTTPNLGLSVPNPFVTQNWGAYINTDLYKIDSLATGYVYGWPIWPLTAAGQVYAFCNGVPSPLAVSSTNGYVLTANAAVPCGLSWGAAGSGTMTSVTASFPTSLFAGCNVTITTSGSIACTFATGQTANRFLSTNGSGAVGFYPIATALGYTPLGTATSFSGIPYLSINSATPTQATSANIYTVLGYTPLIPANNLNDVTSVATARANLGISFTGTGTKTVSATTAGTSGDCAQWTSTGDLGYAAAPCGSGGIAYPPAGIPYSSGTAWATGYSPQGTDAKLLTAGTVTGSTGVTLCTDANGGATTSGCTGGGGLPSGTGIVGTTSGTGVLVNIGASGALAYNTGTNTLDVVTSVVPLFGNTWNIPNLASFTQQPNSATNCASSASPAVCGSAWAGHVVVAASSGSVVVDTTAVTANSEIIVTFDSSLGTALSVTCNTTYDAPYVSARTSGTSFTLSAASNPSTNPACYSYTITN